MKCCQDERFFFPKPGQGKRWRSSAPQAENTQAHSENTQGLGEECSVQAVLAPSVPVHPWDLAAAAPPLEVPWLAVPAQRARGCRPPATPPGHPHEQQTHSSLCTAQHRIGSPHYLQQLQLGLELHLPQVHGPVDSLQPGRERRFGYRRPHSSTWCRGALGEGTHVGQGRPMCCHLSSTADSSNSGVGARGANTVRARDTHVTDLCVWGSVGLLGSTRRFPGFQWDRLLKLKHSGGRVPTLNSSLKTLSSLLFACD